VYLGTLARSRRLETIVDAFALVHQRFPESTLLFVGDGDVPSERRDLEARVSRLGLENAVTFTGFIPMAEAWCIVASANVCLSPFPPSVVQDTASPTKLVEYMALGKTVVANTHPEQSAILDDCGAGVLVDWGSDAFAHGIVWAFAEPQEAADRARRGPTWVRLHRDYASIAAGVNRRLRELLGEPAQPVHLS
jgi:glycosyltransferase involved in cell wall biosynthesis